MVCRYQVLKIVLETIVVKSIGISSGLVTLMFKGFKNPWSSIDQVMFRLTYLMFQFVKKRSTVCNHIERFEITIIFFEGVPKRGMRFRAPGGIRSRWMGKSI
ncbi:hypothetical protein AVEN_132434-1 [Araneus ventricosus]|uniref:Uncharacterized protein n=1 Tax=Araneus ventricosus TaxID=182803 RepID=A0A4Y2IH25_ARAVE|nr:hypothetical protein AVEN_132434-1 [Araneus ventricosus]